MWIHKDYEKQQGCALHIGICMGIPLGISGHSLTHTHPIPIPTICTHTHDPHGYAVPTQMPNYILYVYYIAQQVYEHPWGAADVCINALYDATDMAASTTSHYGQVNKHSKMHYKMHYEPP